MLDLFRAATVSPKGWIFLKGGSLEEEEIRDILQAAIGSWSPLYLTANCLFLEITGVYFLKAPLEVVTLSLPWSLLEVGEG